MWDKVCESDDCDTDFDVIFPCEWPKFWREVVWKFLYPQPSLSNRHTNHKADWLFFSLYSFSLFNLSKKTFVLIISKGFFWASELGWRWLALAQKQERKRKEKEKNNPIYVLGFHYSVFLFPLQNSIYPLFSDLFWLLSVTLLAWRERRRRPIRRKRGKKASPR